MNLVLILLSSFLLAGLAPPLARLFGKRTGLILSLHPILSFFVFLQYAFHPEYPMSIWIHHNPDSWVRLSFWLDTQSLILALLTCSVGLVVLMNVFAGDNSLHEIQAKSRQVFLLMGAMYGLVLFDHMLALFIFWVLINGIVILVIGSAQPGLPTGSTAHTRLFFGASSLCMFLGLLILSLSSGIPEPSQSYTTMFIILEDIVAALAFFFILAGMAVKFHLFHTIYFRCRSLTHQESSGARIFFATFSYSALYILARLFPTV